MAQFVCLKVVSIAGIWTKFTW